MLVTSVLGTMSKIPVAAGTPAVASFLQAISTDYRLIPKTIRGFAKPRKVAAFSFSAHPCVR
jgi:hypothetical protein